LADFFAELKRRHIYRVGAAYVVVAWVLTQVIDVLSQIFELPGSISRPAVILLAIGFPVALIAAWLIESKPHAAVAAAVRSKPASVDWTLCAALALVLLFMGYQQIAPRQVGVDAARSASLNPRIGIALAVLPFANLSDDETQTFFSDGITEEIITALARIPDLRVVARESASQFKGERRDLRAVGQIAGSDASYRGLRTQGRCAGPHHCAACQGRRWRERLGEQLRPRAQRRIRYSGGDCDVNCRSTQDAARSQTGRTVGGQSSH
jgi:adenylate cyclase